MDIREEFHGPNAAYILDLYERYKENPQSVDEATRQFFERWSLQLEEFSREEATILAAPSGLEALEAEKIVGATSLAQAIRSFGYRTAQLDPLGGQPPGDPWLNPEFHHLSDEDLKKLPPDVIGGPVANQAENALEAIHQLQETYETKTGYEYEHIRLPRERDWLRSAAEEGWFRPPKDPINPVGLLERLTQVEAFEHFIHRIFPGKTRFSIEGLDMMVPMLDEILGCAAEAGICTLNIGMSHRGRLNVLAHILGKSYAQILAEFKDPGANFTTYNELGWTGDVKYHKGARRAVTGGEAVQMLVLLPPNPSHLEHIDPVILGMSRSAGSKVDQPGAPQFFPNAALPVLIHGDASFTGQGIVAETLNFSQVPGYMVSGSIHIIANNQIGYTATAEEERSTLYPSDLAKGFKIPIIHVNADDPIACIEAVRTAFAYRQEFGKDFLVDLIGYRRYGHNEGDEPTFTQPKMYEVIEKHPSVRKVWADQLIATGQAELERPEELLQERMKLLQNVYENLEPKEEILEPQLEPPPPGEAKRVNTAVSIERLRDLNQSLLTTPEGFHLHRKIERGMRQRHTALEDPDKASIDWATAEELALASILTDAIPVRFTGEDVERGTFSQRHAVFHDVETGDIYIPLQEIPQAKAAFEIHNSPLSENAAVGFEFGYNIESPRRLVIWEGQYGDFVNVAQPMIDEFVASARAKWEQTPSLVLLLPHGYEGQGPDHSSGRIERFLQLAAQTNLRIANCTTAAQYFHLLRRQAALLATDPLPLIAFTPKSLLRNPLVASTPRQLAEGRWQPVLDDQKASEQPDQINRLILCSGKIYIDLVTSDLREKSPQVGIIRIEQLYPFPEGENRDILASYPKLQEVIWAQEEPINMGAWSFIQPKLARLIDGRWPLHYVGRARNSSPAEGSGAWHAVNQAAIIDRAFGQPVEVEQVELLEEGGLVERE